MRSIRENDTKAKGKPIIYHSFRRYTEISIFRYDVSIKYADDSHLIEIGNMTTICEFCQAMKWPLEAPGLCLAGEKVLLNEIANPPEPLNSLINNTRHDHFKVLLDNIRKYNSAFQMTSFSAIEIRQENFMPKLKILGQLYQLVQYYQARMKNKFISWEMEN